MWALKIISKSGQLCDDKDNILLPVVKVHAEYEELYEVEPWLEGRTDLRGNYWSQGGEPGGRQGLEEGDGIHRYIGREEKWLNTKENSPKSTDRQEYSSKDIKSEI